MCLQKSTLKLMRNHLKGEFLIQIEVTFLLIMIEIPGLWHFKANAVLFQNMITFSIGGGLGPPDPPWIRHWYIATESCGK